MRPRRVLRFVRSLAFLALLTAQPVAAAEVLCDPSYQDCRALLLSRISTEPIRIDVAMLFMEDDAMADALIARHNAGVRVRMLVEPRRNAATPKNQQILDRLQAAGIPMRAKAGGGVLHWKFMVFDTQNVVQYSAANYSDYYFRPATPYADYTDEGIVFSDELGIVDSFRRTFDDAWIDTANFSDYANVSGPLVRAYGLHAIDPELSFVPFEDFASRSVPHYDAEQQRIDVIMYKITEPRHADAIIRAVTRGVPVRLITEPERYRNPSNLWQAYYIDRLYMAGVQIRDRAHAGFLHQKTTLLYGQGMTVFGSSNWTIESNSRQYEHNYFTRKPSFFDWFRVNFERKWTNGTGITETAPFTPLPPDPPVYIAPSAGATGVPTSGAALEWNPGTWGHKADIYFGTSSSPPLVASINASAAGTNTYALPPLAPGTTYYWRIVNKTMALKAASGPVMSFTTAGSGPPPPPPNAPPSVAITQPSNGASFQAPASITIGASASDSDGSVSRVDFYAGGTLLASDASSPYGSVWSGVPAGTYSLTARAFDNAGASTTSAAVTVTVTAAPPPPPPSGLPSPWQTRDIGNVGTAGTAIASGGTFTIEGAGADVWGSADAFRYVYQPVTGDADIVARVASEEYVHAWVKGGVMIRESLAADSPHAFMLVSPGKGLAFQRRLVTGGLSTHTSGGGGAAPAWVKLSRRGNTLTAYRSADGTTWATVGSDSITMPSTVYVGLAVSSHDTAQLATVVLDGVAVQVAAPGPPPPPALPSPWQAQDVGAVGPAGSAAASNGIFTVKGSGADVWNTADAFHYVWQRISGDGEIVARVASVEYVHAWVKAGVMIRETLAAGSPHAFMLVSPGKGLAFQRRLAAGGLSTHTTGGAGAAPAWVKLERRGSVISAYRSSDGVAWTFVGSDSFTMGADVYVGLAVSSHDNSRPATATFEGVSVR